MGGKDMLGGKCSRDAEVTKWLPGDDDAGMIGL